MQDTDKLELAIDGIKGVVSVGEKIMKDGKVGFEDSIHIPELYRALQECVEAGKAYKELGEEVKDIQADEAIKLITKIFS